MKVKVKKLVSQAVIPFYSKNGDAGLDLTAVSKVYDKYGNASFGTGLAFEIPEGYVGLLFPRSSNCKKDLLLSNSVGILDSNYRGEVFFKFKPSLIYIEEDRDGDSYNDIVVAGNSESSTISEQYQVGDRVGQLIILPYPKIEFEEVDELSDTERGTGGFGSSGL